MDKKFFSDQLIVLFNGVKVGKLKLENGKLFFKYYTNWVKNGFSISPFQLPLQTKPFIFKNNKIPIWGVFLDCLPDGWGIYLNIKKCALKNINYHRLNILEKLALTDKTGLGGLDFFPYNKIGKKYKIILDEIIADVMQNYCHLENLKKINELYQLGNSSGGTRPKIHFKDNKGINWIIKLPTSKEDIETGTLEYQANQLAKKCGINTNVSKLIKLDSGIKLFAAKRFDFNGKQKLHTITIAGLLDVDFRWVTIDYNSVFKIISKISINKQKDYYDFFTRMVFNYKFGNCDDHTKNTSFIYDMKLKGYKLAPFYDITKTPTLEYHNMLCNQKEKPTNDDFLTIAKQNGLNIEKCKAIIQKVEQCLIDNKIIKSF